MQCVRYTDAGSQQSKDSVTKHCLKTGVHQLHVKAIIKPRGISPNPDLGIRRADFSTRGHEQCHAGVLYPLLVLGNGRLG